MNEDVTHVVSVVKCVCRIKNIWNKIMFSIKTVSKIKVLWINKAK